MERRDGLRLHILRGARRNHEASKSTSWKDYAEAPGYTRATYFDDWGCSRSIYVRRIPYDGTEASLECPTRRYSRGPTSSNSKCNGRYGAPAEFYLRTNTLHEWRPWEKKF